MTKSILNQGRGLVYIEALGGWLKNRLPTSRGSHPGHSHTRIRPHLVVLGTRTPRPARESPDRYPHN